MRSFFLILVCCLVLGRAAGEDRIRMVRSGQEVKEPPGDRFLTNVIGLLCSASVHSTTYEVKTNTWDDILRSDSFVHVTFVPARKLEVILMDDIAPRHREPVEINEILIPLPEEHGGPGHIYAKAGTNVISVTKHSPLFLKRVAYEPALKLSEAKGYRGLGRLFAEPPTGP